jgi:hypothetical protein
VDFCPLRLAILVLDITPPSESPITVYARSSTASPGAPIRDSARLDYSTPLPMSPSVGRPLFDHSFLDHRAAKTLIRRILRRRQGDTISDDDLYALNKFSDILDGSTIVQWKNGVVSGIRLKWVGIQEIPRQRKTVGCA